MKCFCFLFFFFFFFFFFCFFLWGERSFDRNIFKVPTLCYQLREEDLRKNSSLRGKFKEVKLLSDKISDLKERLGDMDVAHLERERRKLKKMMEDFDRDVSEP